MKYYLLICLIATIIISSLTNGHSFDNHKKDLKRGSDVNIRLLELQAKILLSKAYQNMPAGHGRFDFKKM